MIRATLRQEWRTVAGFGVVGLVCLVEPGWAFFAVRLVSAGVYALVLAVSGAVQ